VRKITWTLEATLGEDPFNRVLINLPLGDASGWPGMLIVKTIGRIRREHFVKGKAIKEID
jgi:hypothetical protein